MGKVNWDTLEIIEEWSPLDPGDPDAKLKQQERLRLLAKLVAEAYFIDKRNRAKREARKAVEAQSSHRRKGIAA